MNATRGLSATLFLLGALSFFMPWLTLSCDGKPVDSATGSELVTGKKVGERGELERQTCAIGCLVSLIAGIVVAVAICKPSNSGIANSLVALAAEFAGFGGSGGTGMARDQPLHPYAS